MRKNIIPKEFKISVREKRWPPGVLGAPSVHPHFQPFFYKEIFTLSNPDNLIKEIKDYYMKEGLEGRIYNKPDHIPMEINIRERKKNMYGVSLSFKASPDCGRMILLEVTQ